MVRILVALRKGGRRGAGLSSTSSVQPWDQDALLPCENLYSDVAFLCMGEIVLWLIELCTSQHFVAIYCGRDGAKKNNRDLYVKLPICTRPLRG